MKGDYYRYWAETSTDECDIKDCEYYTFKRVLRGMEGWGENEPTHLSRSSACIQYTSACIRPCNQSRADPKMLILEAQTYSLDIFKV